MGRNTPFGTTLGFIKAAEREEPDRAAEYLDTQQLPKQARKLVQELAAVLDAADLRELSRKPEGDLDDGLPPGRERVGVVKTDSGSHEIFLERVRRGKEPPIWLFSADTLKRVPGIHNEVGVGWIERHLSGTLLDVRLFGQPLWRLIGIILALPLSFAIARLTARLLIPAIPAVFSRIAKRPVDYPAAKLKWPISLLVMALVFYVVSLIAFSAVSRLFWGYVAATVAVIAFTWIGLRLIDDAADLFGRGAQARLGDGGIAMSRLLTKLSKAVVVIIGVMVLFYIAGVNLTALLTGVGIGGVAIALAAQKSLENLFGAMTIISDKPIRVGDLCRAGEIRGTVEDIGLRSTRIRTLDRSVVSVPNGQLLTMGLENFSLRDKFLFHHRIQLDYETSGGQVRAVIAAIRDMFQEHPKVEMLSSRVRLTAFRDLSIEVEVFVYVIEKSYEEFLSVQEEFLLRIMDIVEDHGVQFASLPAAKHPVKDKSANA